MSNSASLSHQPLESPTPAPLSLPPSHFAKLSPASFLAAHLPSTRPSRRTPFQARPPNIQIGSLTHANGSAVIRLGHTSVACGIRAEILDSRDTNAPYVLSMPPASHKDADIIAELGLLVPNIELATGCNPMYLPGNPPTTVAQSLTQRVITLLRIADLIRLSDLEIWDRTLDSSNPGSKESTDDDNDNDAMEDDDDEKEGREDEEERKPEVKAYWTLYIDMWVLSLDGGAFDAAWGSVITALRDTLLPKAWWDMDRDGVLCDPHRSQARRLSLRGFPTPLSFVAFNPPENAGSKKLKDETYVLTDPDDFEEGCCSQTITAVVDDGGSKLLRMEMSGGTLLDLRDLDKITQRAGERWKEWIKAHSDAFKSGP